MVTCLSIALGGDCLGFEAVLNRSFIMVGSCSEGCGTATAEEMEGITSMQQHLEAFLLQSLHTLYLALTLFCCLLPKPVWSENLEQDTARGRYLFSQEGKIRVK